MGEYTVYCRCCGKQFDLNDLALEFNEDFFCDLDCLFKYVDNRTQEVIIDREILNYYER